jgi:hypothetical protein
MSNSDPIYQASLYLKGDELDPDQVTRQLQIEPSRSHRKGDVRTTSAGSVVVKKIGFWSVSYEVADSSLAALRDLASSLVARGVLPLEISGVDEAYFDIYIAFMSEDGRGDAQFVLDPDTVAALHGTGIPIQVTFAAVLV